MIHKFLFAVVVSAGLLAGSTVFADEESDARYIVEQSLTREILQGSLVVLRPVLISAIENDLRERDIVLSDPGRFYDILVEEFTDALIEKSHAKLTTLYLDSFTPQELAGIAAFYQTDSGQALLAQTPDLMKAASQIGGIAGQEAIQELKPRIAERLQRENVQVTRDEGMMKRLLRALGL